MYRRIKKKYVEMSWCLSTKFFQMISTDYTDIFKGLMMDAIWMRVESSLSEKENKKFVERQHQIYSSLHSTTGQNIQHYISL